ncbi:MAG: alpha/beta hydrolase [Leptospiraceae bacterium]|nr:alpha/beta hydrolase [Leptospiraceae bacterium]MDW8306554.1 alpha/beta hydrolase [Leptospiraceae bacterium]
MTDHLTYLPEEQHSLLSQILWEILYSLLYPLLYLLGIFIHPKPRDGQKRTVVLVPGFMGSGLYLTNLQRELSRQGYATHIVPLGFQMGDIRKKARLLENYLENNDLHDCYIIGHSMGGLIALQMSYRGRDRIRKLYLANVPLKGTYLALLALFCLAGWQMLPFSSFIKKMADHFHTFVNTQTIFSRWDQIIIPHEYLRMNRFDDVEFAEIGHLNLVMGKNGIRCLIDLIEMEEKKDLRASTPPSLPGKTARRKKSDETRKKKKKGKK